jgi:imidazole glycerol-phosphate synthase subunit HisF
MLKKRIIPCLDVMNGRTVKGINFEQIADAGDAVALAKKYSNEGADELVLLDITATTENRGTTINMVQQVAQQIRIPFTVGGGIKTLNDAGKLLYAGADKVSINSAAVNNIDLVTQIANYYGEQCVVVAIDTKHVDGEDWVFINGGKKATGIKTLAWAKQVANAGAGEILLTSMDHDGTKQGFALDLLNKMSAIVNIPIIASGGAGAITHFEDLFTQTSIPAGLAASIFHYGQIGLQELKTALIQKNIA